jgi:hypothetical protein
MSGAMKIHTSYTAFIRGQLSDSDPCAPVLNDLMGCTAQLCLSALKFCCRVFLEHWDVLKPLRDPERKTAAEALIHTTKHNDAQYPEFDVRFHGLPSGVRRAIRNDALGRVSSYVSNHKNWEALKPSERGAEPTLGLPSRYQLTFYQTERKTEGLKRGQILLKLYNGKTWEWYTFLIKPSDARYLARMAERHAMLSPMVEKVRGAYRIRFCFEDKRELVSDENKLSYRILAVDLGINAAATWSVMTADGTVHARGVIHARAEEDRLWHILNRVRKYQRRKKHPKSIYRFVRHANRALSICTARFLMAVAELYNVDCIVFEHLDKTGSARGRLASRIHHWRACDVQHRVETMAHRDGMRLSRVCAWGTSKLAFDGSGKVIRDKHNHSICTFANGKQYNCDLSASYNIGARFFLRELKKVYPDLEMPATPQRTLSTLYDVRNQVQHNEAAA